ncbi:hypothetical protein [Mucilaginibacter mali]|uniref:hypothetical protein n=1 Tax=Mucilaginibacter mali TaxID=2740462 RepID=UPI001F400515|nr:hypothetical protein [Mucilaginibacter mali]
MNKPEKNKWVKLCFVFRKTYVFISYEDGMGNKVEKAGKEFRTVDLPFFTSVRINTAIDAHLAQMLDAEPRERMTPYGPKNLPLAIFVDQELDLPLKTLVGRLWSIRNFNYWRDLFGHLLDHKNYQFIHHRVIRKRPAFELPFRIAIFGDSAGEIRSKIEDWNWLKTDPNTQEYGLQLINADSLAGQQQEDIDILIMNTPRSPEWKDIPAIAPRFVILLDAFYPEWTGMHTHYPDSSLLVIHEIPRDNGRIFLKELLYSIIHDYPLHEAVAFAVQRSSPLDVAPVLFTDAVANHSLRIVDGLDGFKASVAQYASTVNPGDLNQFIQKLPPSAGDKLRTAFSGSSGLGGYFHSMKSFGGDFGRETSGLVPLSGEIQYFKTYQQPQFDRYIADIKSLSNTPEIFEAFRQNQQRVVDATLDQLTDTLRYIPTNRFSPLFHGGRYRLNVQIGQHSAESLMTGNIGPIDPLLPDPDDKEGHELEVVVFPKDFILTSKPRKKIKLPLLGGSTIARFLLEIPPGRDRAQLRFGIFRKNYLLQAFILEAALGDDFKTLDTPAITVRMDLATSAKYTNLDQVGQRDLYIGINAGNDGTHSLFIKDDDIVREVHGLNESILKDAQDEFSNLLKTAYFNGKYLRFPLFATTADHEAFFAEVRKFAKIGRLYYDRLFSSNDKAFRASLRRLRDHKDLSFQIARHEVNYAFPWALIYDYYLLPPAAGAAEYPVCMGERLDEDLYAEFKCADGEGCPHNPGLSTYCIEGFWGFRHRIEQLLTTVDKPLDTVPVVDGKNKKVFYVNNFSEPYSNQLRTKLMTDYPLQEITHECDLIDLLWNEQSRPSSLVVFGHLETKTIPGEPPEERILTFLRDTWPADAGNLPLNKWLYHRLLINKITKDDSWSGEPLPVVFLISCYNATMTVNSLNSMIQDFHTAGASAVIGTECEITPDLGAAFISEVLDSLYLDRKELGEAIQAFNQNRFRSYNPLAFVFTCFGNSNLKIT